MVVFQILHDHLYQPNEHKLVCTLDWPISAVARVENGNVYIRVEQRPAGIIPLVLEIHHQSASILKFSPPIHNIHTYFQMHNQFFVVGKRVFNLKR